MKLNRSIKILALGAVVALNLITPAFADESLDTSKRGLSSQKLYSVQKTMTKKNMDPEQMKERLEKSLEKLETAYEEGKIDQERYETTKANIEDKLEKIEDGDYSFMEERKDKRNMDPEQMKERLEKSLEKLETAYEEGKIDQERYETTKANIEDKLEKIEDGDYSFMEERKDKRNMDPEQMKERLEKALEKLESDYEEGKIDEERYKTSKANIEDKLEKIENGDYSFMEERKDRRNMDPEQMKERLEKALEKLESDYEEGKIDKERYEASKALIEENLEKIENGDYSFKNRPVEKRDVDPEKMQEMLENALEKLEKAYEDGKIDEERYNAAKLHMEEKLEELDN